MLEWCARFSFLGLLESFYVVKSVTTVLAVHMQSYQL